MKSRSWNYNLLIIIWFNFNILPNWIPYKILNLLRSLIQINNLIVIHPFSNHSNIHHHNKHLRSLIQINNLLIIHPFSKHSNIHHNKHLKYIINKFHLCSLIKILKQQPGINLYKQIKASIRSCQLNLFSK